MSEPILKRRLLRGLKLMPLQRLAEAKLLEFPRHEAQLLSVS
jgi:hypothetical protein